MIFLTQSTRSVPKISGSGNFLRWPLKNVPLRRILVDMSHVITSSLFRKWPERGWRWLRVSMKAGHFLEGCLNAGGTNRYLTAGLFLDGGWLLNPKKVTMDWSQLGKYFRVIAISILHVYSISWARSNPPKGRLWLRKIQSNNHLQSPDAFSGEEGNKSSYKNADPKIFCSLLTLNYLNWSCGLSS